VSIALMILRENCCSHLPDIAEGSGREYGGPPTSAVRRACQRLFGRSPPSAISCDAEVSGGILG